MTDIDYSLYKHGLYLKMKLCLTHLKKNIYKFLKFYCYFIEKLNEQFRQFMNLVRSIGRVIVTLGKSIEIRKFKRCVTT